MTFRIINAILDEVGVGFFIILIIGTVLVFAAISVSSNKPSVEQTVVDDAVRIYTECVEREVFTEETCVNLATRNR